MQSREPVCDRPSVQAKLDELRSKNCNSLSALRPLSEEASANRAAQRLEQGTTSVARSCRHDIRPVSPITAADPTLPNRIATAPITAPGVLHRPQPGPARPRDGHARRRRSNVALVPTRGASRKSRCRKLAGPFGARADGRGTWPTQTMRPATALVRPSPSGRRQRPVARARREASRHLRCRRDLPGLGGSR